MKKKNKKILKGVLLGMACALATGLVLQVTNVFDLFTKETPTEEPSEEVKLGTPVPNTGFVEKIYFNTNLSVEEVVALLTPSLEDVFAVDGNENYLFINSDNTTIISFTTDGANSFNELNINYMSNDEVINVFNKTNGWNNDFNGIIELNSDNALGELLPQMGISDRNSELSSLFSITPFESEVN